MSPGSCAIDLLASGTSPNALRSQTDAIEVEPGHQDDGVNTELPLARKHRLALFPENGATGGFVAGSLAIAELL